MKLSKPIWYALILTVVVAAFLSLSDGPAKGSSSKKSSAVAKKSSKPGQFDEADYKAKFQAVSTAAKNVFMPVAGLSSGAPGIPSKTDAIPAAFAGGDSNWVYTGTAEVDGVPVALFENTSDREGVFLKHGERWKSSRVLQIGPDYVVLASESGLTHRVALPPYNMAVESGPMDVSGAARAVLSPRVSVTPEATPPTLPNEPENQND
ncbi:MAG: hypothetical protein U0R49_09995 [Fimbriimonadales bacterium]